MKKLFSVLLFSSVFLFAGCSKERWIYGQALEMQSNDEVGIVSFTMQEGSSQEIGILLTDETSIESWINNGDDGKRYRLSKEELENANVSVQIHNSERTLVKENGEKIPAYNAKKIEIIAKDTGERIKLKDGTEVEIWEESHENPKVYKLENGAEILRDGGRTGPSNAMVPEQEKFEDLKKKVQTRILKYIEEKIVLYDVTEELEKAYAAYRKKTEQEEFDTPILCQDIVLCASNDRMLYFTVTGTTSEKGEHTKEIGMGMAFDRETGEPVEMWNLFRCTKKELVQTILKCSKISDPVLEQEMLAELRSEYIFFEPETLEVNFPNGTLQSKEEEGKDYDTFAFDWSEKAIKEIVHDWAIPKEIHQE